MGISQVDFSEAQDKAVDNRLPVGGWRVYRTGYEMRHYNEGEFGFWYVEAVAGPVGVVADSEADGLTRNGPARLEPPADVYAPLRLPGLFLEFAQLFKGGIELGDAAPVVLDWVERYGALGVHTHYPETDGWTTGRLDYRESVLTFVRLSVEAGRCLQLYEAANHPDGPDLSKLRAMGVVGDTPRQLSDRAEAEYLSTLDKNLQNETFTRMYRYQDRGRLQRGPGFQSLLGAMWLQFAALVEAPEEEIVRCKWCGDLVNFETGEPPPADAPRGQRGKRKTHSNREYCPSKNGKLDQCKNDYNAEAARKRKKRAR